MNSKENDPPALAHKKEQDRRVVSDQEEYFNAQFDAQPVYLSPGDVICTDSQDEMIVSTVGNGVIISIHDINLKLGAVGYLLLPQEVLNCFPHFETANPATLQKAFEPLEKCIGEMKKRGAGKGRIRIRLIGGGATPNDDTDSGTKNYVFAREYVTRKGLSILNEDLGGLYVRRIHFFPSSGKLVRRVLKRAEDFSKILEIENAFQKSMSSEDLPSS